MHHSVAIVEKEEFILLSFKTQLQNLVYFASQVKKKQKNCPYQTLFTLYNKNGNFFGSSPLNFLLQNWVHFHSLIFQTIIVQKCPEFAALGTCLVLVQRYPWCWAQRLHTHQCKHNMRPTLRNQQ